MKNVSFGSIWDDIQNIRDNEWAKKAIIVSNEYISKDPYNVQAYMQLIDIYYSLWELEKAEKPIDFLLSFNLQGSSVEETLLHYVKAVLLSEKTKWEDAKKHIKLSLKKVPENLEYKRLLSTIEFRSWNKTKWYSLLKDVLDNWFLDPDILLNWINMSLSLGFFDDAKKYVNIYFEKRENIKFFSKNKSYYDKKMYNYWESLFNDK